MPVQYVVDMHCYQSISLVQDMVIVDVMKPKNNNIMYLTDIIIIIIIIGYEPADVTVHPPPKKSNTTYITVNYITFWIIFINK